MNNNNIGFLYSARSTLQGAPTLPGYARLLISTLTAFQGIPSYRNPFDTWVENGKCKCRLMSCQRTLVPRWDSNRGPCNSQSDDLSTVNNSGNEAVYLSLILFGCIIKIVAGVNNSNQITR